MNKPLDELYLTWLYGQVVSVTEKTASRNFWKLLKILYTKEFIWIIANDDNRAEDGRDLRREFMEYEDIDPREVRGWIDIGCSVLEMMIGLSRRLSFESDREPREWFWELIANLTLQEYNDANHIPEDEIDEILDQLIWRTYKRNGSGGLFPLRHPIDDQREVEIWYQMNTYLLERA